MRIITESFFDGFGPGALFVRPTRSGAPSRVFASYEEFATLGRRYDELIGFLQAQLPAEFLQLSLSQLKISASEQNLLSLAYRHPSILTLAAACGETPDDIGTRLERLTQRLAARKLPSS